MGSSVKKPIIGILGGIGSGKSSVAAEFGRLGCAIIDADHIAGELLGEHSVRQSVIEAFGDIVFDSSGQIDRRKLADIVFADAAKLSLLNQLIHPLVLKRVEQLIEVYNRQSGVVGIVLDMPLLAEVGWAERCDRLIFVDCDLRLRAKRAKKAGICGENELKKRENFQISLDKKVEMADNVINNNSSLRSLAGQVTDIFTCIMKN